ncbi:DUF3857 domain-containing protein [uncultured Paludibaculum sp.]|uniref:DUF3857 domain-containing protein n=1 Tax=uncultured Paludibaculum sp. TaxID=1765020 RepID=UPI002AAAE5CC|nr:DUF3857 domain-containing protein [uncultured Paludibaculum sp.]
MASSSIILAAFTLASSLLYAADDTPSWVKELSGVTLPAYPPKVNNVVLFNEEHTVVAATGRLTTTTRTAIKILNQQGGDVLFLDSYDSVTGKVRDFRAWMLPPSGKVKKYGKDEIVDVACAGNDVYNECRKRVVSGKRDAEPGAIFAYESIIEYQSFSNQLVFHFQDGLPVRLARLRVTLPAGWELQSKSFNGAPKEALADGAYTWQMENLPAIEPEPASPAFPSIAPWVGVNLLEPGGKHPLLTWTETAKVLAELNDGQSEPGELVAAKARNLVEGATSEMDKIRAIGRFTQQVNYVSVQTNIAKGGGYRPHPAEQVFKKLYGDCKDKANLTRAMLRAVGITAFPVAIYSGDRTHVTQEWPSLGAFNHAISAIRVSPETKEPAVLDDPKLGRLLFFDPTDPYVKPGFLPDHEQASLALVGTTEGGSLVRVPAAAPAATAHHREVEASLGADGSISGKFTDKRTGEALAGAVGEYRALSKVDYQKRLERWIGRSVQGAATSNLETEDGSDQFVLRGQFASQHFAQQPQARMIIFKAGLLEYDDWRLTAKTRQYPVVIDTDALSETVRIQLPAEYKIDELPSAMRLDSPYGKYEATWTAEGQSVLFRRKLEIPAQTIPAAKYSELKQFLDAVAGSANSPVVLVR